jgi:hypothetical protein
MDETYQYGYINTGFLDFANFYSKIDECISLSKTHPSSASPPNHEYIRLWPGGTIRNFDSILSTVYRARSCLSKRKRYGVRLELGKHLTFPRQTSILRGMFI